MSQWTKIEIETTIAEVNGVWERIRQDHVAMPLEAQISIFEQTMTNLRGITMGKKFR